MFLLRSSVRRIRYIKDKLFCGQVLVAPGEPHACLKVFKSLGLAG